MNITTDCSSKVPTLVYSLPVFITPIQKNEIVLNARFQCIHLDSKISLRETCQDNVEAEKRDTELNFESLKQLHHEEKEMCGTQYLLKINSMVSFTECLLKIDKFVENQLISVLNNKKKLVDCLNEVKNRTSQLEKVKSDMDVEFVNLSTKVYDQEQLIEKQDTTIYKLKRLAENQNKGWANVHLSPVCENECLFEKEIYLKDEIGRRDVEINCVRNKYEAMKNAAEQMVEKNNRIKAKLREYVELKEKKYMFEKKIEDLRKQLRAEDERSCELNFQIMLYKGRFEEYEDENKQRKDKSTWKQVTSNQRRNSSGSPLSALPRTPKVNFLKIKPVNASLSNSPVLRKKSYKT